MSDKADGTSFCGRHAIVFTEKLAPLTRLTPELVEVGKTLLEEWATARCLRVINFYVDDKDQDDLDHCRPRGIAVRVAALDHYPSETVRSSILTGTGVMGADVLQGRDEWVPIETLQRLGLLKA